MSFLEYIKRIDRIFFILIHNDSEHKVLDGVMLLLRNPLTWIPVYIFILFFIIRKTGKRAWLFIVLSLVTVAFTYCVSAFILQPVFEVLSPCFDPEVHKFVRGIIDCDGMYSFPSAHTANNFAIASFWFWSLYKITGKKWKWLWIWVSLIGYAQIYVGRHFPSDIAAGALLGLYIGMFMAKIFEYTWNIEKDFHEIAI